MLNPHELMKKIEDYFANTSKEQIVAAVQQAGYDFYKSINASSFYCRGEVSFELSIHRNSITEAIRTSIELEKLTYGKLDISAENITTQNYNKNSDIIHKYMKAA